MTRREELERLRDGLIGGGVDCAAVLTLFSRDALHFLSACNGDMNAALAFFKSVLPGWSGGAGIDEGVSRGVLYFPGCDEEYHTEADTPACAFLLACIDALIAQEGQE